MARFNTHFENPIPAPVQVGLKISNPPNGYRVAPINSSSTFRVRKVMSLETMITLRMEGQYLNILWTGGWVMREWTWGWEVHRWIHSLYDDGGVDRGGCQDETKHWRKSWMDTRSIQALLRAGNAAILHTNQNENTSYYYHYTYSSVMMSFTELLLYFH